MILDERILIIKGKKGPIYSIQWNPVKDEFIVVYGSMIKFSCFNFKPLELII